MTKAEWRGVLLAIALWEPRGTSIELEPEDRSSLRDQIAIEIARTLKTDPEGAMTMMQALRMTQP